MACGASFRYSVVDAWGHASRARYCPAVPTGNIQRPDGVWSLEARYTIRATDDTLIQVVNRGLRHGPAEVLERVFRGETVSPDEYYFRSAAQFEAPVGGPHEWLNKGIFVGVAERRVSEAIVRFHLVT